MTATEQREWTVGELANAAGVTVRALHHYDRIGLLVPSERSSGGHRRYRAKDVERLFRIVALRELGFNLDTIASVLDSERGRLLETARGQLERVERSLELETRLRSRLSQLVELLERSQEPSAEQLVKTMEVMSMTIKLDRIYTRTGDRGETELADGSRVPKTDPRLDVAELEELNAQIGVALATGEVTEEHSAWLERVQNDLFDIGAEQTSAAKAGGRGTPSVSSGYVAWLERACDEANRTLAPLESFVLPGGSAAAAQLHVCRTICRRVERRMLAIEDLSPEAARYLNRLSDLLFILSRHAVHGAERLWEPGASAGDTDCPTGLTRQRSHRRAKRSAPTPPPGT